MANITKELLAKLMKAASPEEAAELLKAEGITDAPMDTVWQQLETLRGQAAQDAQELSLDELDDVAGGRNWWTEGCAATVEKGSNCWKTDGGCAMSNIAYVNMPNAYCPKCGASCLKQKVVDSDRSYVRCLNCGGFYLDAEDGQSNRGGASGGW